ncbi:hypothetical protein [Maribacter sp. IgM3_T14_3]|uniref:hypothetical protein n=1 Tax=Maribacter sp. IgM3_T14_3 TaxID=3415140 RepID=UPI003C6EF9B2
MDNLGINTKITKEDIKLIMIFDGSVSNAKKIVTLVEGRLKEILKAKLKMESVVLKCSINPIPDHEGNYFIITKIKKPIKCKVINWVEPLMISSILKDLNYWFPLNDIE